MLRPKLIAPLYKGARAVFVAGARQNPGEAPLPPDDGLRDQQYRHYSPSSGKAGSDQRDSVLGRQSDHIRKLPAEPWAGGRPPWNATEPGWYRAQEADLAPVWQGIPPEVLAADQRSGLTAPAGLNGPVPCFPPAPAVIVPAFYPSAVPSGKVPSSAALNEQSQEESGRSRRAQLELLRGADKKNASTAVETGGPYDARGFVSIPAGARRQETTNGQHIKPAVVVPRGHVKPAPASPGLPPVHPARCHTERGQFQAQSSVAPLQVHALAAETVDQPTTVAGLGPAAPCNDRLPTGSTLSKSGGQDGRRRIRGGKTGPSQKQLHKNLDINLPELGGKPVTGGQFGGRLDLLQLNAFEGHGAMTTNGDLPTQQRQPLQSQGRGRGQQGSGRDKRQGTMLKHELMNGVAATLARISRQQNHEGLAEAMEAWEPHLNLHRLCDVLKGTKDPATALALFHWARTRPWYAPDVFLYTTLFGVLGRAREFHHLDALVAEMRADGVVPTGVTYNRLIHVYGKANRLPEVLKLRAEMSKASIPPDYITFSTLMDCFCKAGFHDKVLEVYEDFTATGNIPDAAIYNVLMNSYGRAGDILTAAEIFRHMAASGCPLSNTSYNTMIDLYGKSGRARDALHLFDEMRSAGLTPDAWTYSTVIDSCGKNGMPQRAEELFAQMQADGVEADTVAWTTLVHMWGRADNPGRAAMWFARMLQAGCRPSIASYNSLLFVLIRAGMYDDARRLHAEALAGGGAGRGLQQRASLMTYTLLLSSFTQCTDAAGAKALLDCMAACDHPMHALLELLLQHNDLAEEHIEGSTAASWHKVAHMLEEGIGSEALDMRRAFTDSLVQFLFTCGLGSRAAKVWVLARDRHTFPYAIRAPGGSTPGLWRLDLHSMSANTALVAALTELAQLRTAALALGSDISAFPLELEIITGWGRHSRSRGGSGVKRVVEEALEAMCSPFRTVYPNVGSLHAPGTAVKPWLLQPGMAQKLAFVDAPRF